MTEHWKQFSLYPPGCRNKFAPRQVLHRFLPQFVQRAPLQKWHVLFEPSALVRIVVDDFDIASTLRFAGDLAKDVGLQYEPGDCSSEHDKTLVWPGEDFYPVIGDEYDEELWDALTKYLQACGEWSLAVSKTDPSKQLEMTRKAVHLTLNALGLNYLEESTLCRYHADVCVELMKRFYRM